MIVVVCPNCGAKSDDGAIYTNESVTRICCFDGIDEETGEFKFNGEDEVFWDTSTTEKEDGAYSLFCRDCGEDFLYTEVKG